MRLSRNWSNSYQPILAGFGNFGSRVGGTMGKVREPQIILKTDQRNVLLEMGLGGKLQARSSGWDENRTFLENDVLEVEYGMAAG